MEGDRVFEFVFERGGDNFSSTLKVPINIENLKSKDVAEFCARITRFHQIPCFVDAALNSSLKSYLHEELTQLKNKNSSECVSAICNNPALAKEFGNIVAKRYKQTWMSYSKPVCDQINDFPRAYHYLIHSAAMQILLQLERKFHTDLAKVIVNKEQSIVKMQERHQLEMARICEHVGFAYSNEDVTGLASKHLADSERMLAHWNNEYTEITSKQKTQFHQMLVDLHREMEANSHKIDFNGQAYNTIKKIVDEEVAMPLEDLSDLSSSPAVSASPSSASNVSSRSVQMEESFTINLGAQLKTMHNIRLVVTDILNFARYSDEGEVEAQRFQTAMSLYSSSLSALILFTDQRLGYQTNVQKELSSICHSSTEFHFKSLDEQLDDVKREVIAYRSQQQGTDSGLNTVEGVHLNEGDFYITKHSNLSQVHVVFHLVADENTLQTKASLSNVTSRHPVITSLRQILKVASSNDIRMITIPLLLTHELTEEITFQWCVKRAELVMKCVKGFMMEMATWDGGVSKTIQFVIPPGVSEEVFDRLRSTLPEVFRTTSSRDLTRSKAPTSR